ncbi:hypothetical protein [Accumulibacter sp.]|uniref:hypothetical protein n=1 Tax=Accumulibacter sp. TaxID=2053492 RepID=UPI002D1F9C05|nr:hypothetical protein [Accumulibacter sp.]
MSVAPGEQTGNAEYSAICRESPQTAVHGHVPCPSGLAAFSTGYVIGLSSGKPGLSREVLPSFAQRASFKRSPRACVALAEAPLRFRAAIPSNGFCSETMDR